MLRKMMQHPHGDWCRVIPMGIREKINVKIKKCPKNRKHKNNLLLIETCNQIMKSNPIFIDTI
jgi:hypothetical protein